MSQADRAHSTSGSIGQFALTINDLNTTLNEEPRVSHKRLALALGYVDDRKLLRLAERHREALLRFGEVSATVAETTPRGGRPGKVEWYNKRQVLYLCAKSEMGQATDTTIAMVEVFDAHLARSLPAPDPDLAGLNHVLEHEMPAGDFAFLRIGRRTVMVDTTCFRPGRTEEAVLLHPDGRVTIGFVQQRDDVDTRIVRNALEAPRRPRKGERPAAQVADVVHVLGAVVRPSRAILGERGARERVGGTSSPETGRGRAGAPRDGGNGTRPTMARDGGPASPSQLTLTDQRGAKLPRPFQPGSDGLKDLIQVVRSANVRMERDRALTFGRALHETLEDVVARNFDPAASLRGVLFDYDERRATGDMVERLRRQGRRPGQTAVRARDVTASVGARKISS